MVCCSAAWCKLLEVRLGMLEVSPDCEVLGVLNNMNNLDVC